MADLEKEKLSEVDMNKKENSNSVEKVITPEEEYEKALKRRKKLSSWGLVLLTVAEIIVVGGLGQKTQVDDLQRRVLREHEMRSSGLCIFLMKVHIRANFLNRKKVEKEHLHGMMVLCMKASGKMTRCADKAHIQHQTA